MTGRRNPSALHVVWPFAAALAVLFAWKVLLGLLVIAVAVGSFVVGLRTQKRATRRRLA